MIETLRRFGVRCTFNMCNVQTYMLLFDGTAKFVSEHYLSTRISLKKSIFELNAFVEYVDFILKTIHKNYAHFYNINGRDVKTMFQLIQTGQV